MSAPLVKGNRTESVSLQEVLCLKQSKTKRPVKEEFQRSRLWVFGVGSSSGKISRTLPDKQVRTAGFYLLFVVCPFVIYTPI